jgi:hypothetical protein
MRHRQICPSSSAAAKKPATPEYGNLKTGRQLSSDTTVTLSSEQIYRLHCENDARDRACQINPAGAAVRSYRHTDLPVSPCCKRRLCTPWATKNPRKYRGSATQPSSGFIVSAVLCTATYTDAAESCVDDRRRSS